MNKDHQLDSQPKDNNSSISAFTPAPYNLPTTPTRVSDRRFSNPTLKLRQLRIGDRLNSIGSDVTPFSKVSLTPRREYTPLYGVSRNDSISQYSTPVVMPRRNYLLEAR